jgi:hypothetical protein
MTVWDHFFGLLAAFSAPVSILDFESLGIPPPRGGGQRRQAGGHQQVTGAQSDMAGCFREFRDDQASQRHTN